MSTEQILESRQFRIAMLIATLIFLFAVLAGSCGYARHTVNAYRHVTDTTQGRNYTTGHLNYQY